MTPDAPPPVSTMRRDLISAYLASGMKVASWAIVTAIVVRYGRSENLGLLTLVRSTLGLLGICTLGLAPAMVRMVGETLSVRVLSAEQSQPSPPSRVLSYASARLETQKQNDPSLIVYASGMLLSIVLAVAGFIIVAMYAAFFRDIHHVPEIPRQYIIERFVLWMGGGLMLRLMSDAPSARLQVRGYIWLDNLLLAGGEALWAILTWQQTDTYYYSHFSETLLHPGYAFFVSGLCLFSARLIAVRAIDLNLSYEHAPIQWRIIRQLLNFGILVTIAQLADFLYAPTDYLLINYLLEPSLGSVYAPAVQIDSALLLIVVSMGNVLLPKTVLAHVNDNYSLVRDYYIKGTLASTALLLAATLLVWTCSERILNLWLGNPSPATTAILPFILIHTVVGGSSAVGRSILLGMGKVKPFTIAVLVAGVSNVILSYVFVRYAGLGLKGIVLGTICAVVGRCAIWQPWYVWKCLRENQPQMNADERR